MVAIDPREWEGPQWLLAGLVVLLLAATLYAGTTSAAAFGAYNPAWDGSQAARDLAGADSRETVIARSTGEYGTLDPTESVAVVLSPERSYEAEAAGDVRAFVREGGTLVVAGDVGGETNDLLRGVGVESRIDGRALRDEREYTRSPAFPVATATEEMESDRIEELALNYPSAVNASANATVLARSSGYSYLDTDGDEELDDAETLRQRPVVVVEQVGEGQVIVVSDPSLFINSMLDERDNRAFTTSLFEGSETVLFDYSHSGGIPILVQFALTLRSSALGRLALPLLLVLGAALALRGWPGRPFRRLLGRDRDEPMILSTDDRIRAIEARHPDWEPERVRRVAKRINPPSPKGGNDD